MRDICESLNSNKSFELNMHEIDYNKLISFLDSMKRKEEIILKIEYNSTSNKWIGYSVSKTNKNINNKTYLS